jgi:hypothetical protein
VTGAERHEGLEDRHVVLCVGASPGALARARTLQPHLRTRTTVLAHPDLPGLDPALPGLLVQAAPPDAAPLDTDPLPALLTQVRSLAPDVVVVDGGIDPRRVAASVAVPVIGVRRPRWTPAAPGDVEPAGWLAPFPRSLDLGPTPPPEGTRTWYAGFVSPYLGSRLTRGAARRRLGLDPQARHVTVAPGAEGFGVDRPMIRAAAGRAPTWSFSVVGGCHGFDEPDDDRVRFAPWTDAMLVHLVAADLVVTGGSPSAVADAAAVRRPLAVIPRAADEDEERFAAALEAVGAAIVVPSWPPAFVWPALLAEVLDLPARPLRRLADEHGARRAAAWLEAWGAEPDSPAL